MSQSTYVRPRALPNRRRCHSTPPWSLRDILPGFYRRGHTTESLYIDPHMLRDATSIRPWVELPLSTLMLIDDRYVLKLVPLTWDVDTIVRHMRVAGSVIPVPRVHDWGRPANANSCYILMDFVRGICFSSVVDKHGHFAAVRLKHEMANIVDRLALVGLSHGDLYPRNVMVDEYYNVVSVLDWDYAARIEVAGDEYLRRVTSRYPSRQRLRLPSDGDDSWDWCFLRHALEHGEASYRRFKDARVPAASLSFCRRSASVLDTLVPANPTIPDAAPPDRRRRVVLLVSGSHDTWSYLLKYLTSDASLSVCFVVFDDPKWIGLLSSTSEDTPYCVMNPAHHTPQRRIRLHRNQPPAGFDTDLAEVIAEARAHVVVACNWPHKPGSVFWRMAAVPPLLTSPDVPLAVLRLDRSQSRISLTSVSRRVAPSVLLEHAFSAEELDSNDLRSQRSREFVSDAAACVGKLMH